MKKVILVIFCTTILMSGCSSNTADTVSNDVQQVNVSYDQMNNEGVGWGFVRKKGAPPEIPNSQKEVLRKYDCYYIDENAPKTLYLTRVTKTATRQRFWTFWSRLQRLRHSL